jgi:hypothetical protein
MMCWANVAYHMQDEEEVVALKAQNCISQMKGTYPTVGRLYGYLSRYSHWGHVIHGQFLDLRGEHVGILKASVRYRAMALALCLVIVDVFVEVIKPIYLDKSHGLVLRVQGVLDRSATRKTYQNLTKIVELSKLTDLQEIQSLLQ